MNQRLIWSFNDAGLFNGLLQKLFDDKTAAKNHWQ